MKKVTGKLTTKILLTDEQQVDFALEHADQNCRSIVECGCMPVKRVKSKALYKYDMNNPDKFMSKDVNRALLYLRSRGGKLPFKMVEKDDFVWFD